MSHKTGRPRAENPKDVVIRCRISKDFNSEIENYCRIHNVTKTDIIRAGIETVIRKEVAATTDERNP